MLTGFRRSLLTAGVLAIMAAPAQAQQMPPGTGTNYEMRLTALEDQMRALNGNIEQLSFAVRRLDQAMQRMQSDNEVRFGRMEANAAAAAAAPPAPMPPPPPTTTISSPSPAAAAAAEPPPTTIEAPTSTAAAEPPPPTAPVKGSLGGLKVQQDGKVTGAINNPQAPALPDTPADYGLTPQEQYDRAFDLLRQTDYDAAGDAFKSFIDKNPHDKLIEEAKYWYAETLYVRDKFDASAIAFADAWEQNASGPKAPESLLKLAMSLEKLNKISDACTTLDSLKSKYPKAPVKVRQNADQERVNLKCSALQAPAASKPAASSKKQ